MELKEAFKIVLELAESAILTEDTDLSKERDRQMDAVDMVEKFWDKFADLTNES